MQWLYLACLCAAIGCLLLVDYHWKLAFWKNTKQTIATLFTAILVFIVWDFIGISLKIFFHGGSEYTLPFRLAPEFPLEEIFFLFLLTFSTLLIFNGVQLWRSRTSS